MEKELRIYWKYIVCVILGVFVNFSIQQNGLPPSPCPSTFQYRYDGMEWYGMAQIQTLPSAQTTKLQIVLSLRGVLPWVVWKYPFFHRQYLGTLELLSSREAANQEILSGQPIKYRVRFPLQSPLPKLTQISVNGRTLCSGPPETGPPYVTQITLEHTLFTIYQKMDPGKRVSTIFFKLELSTQYPDFNEYFQQSYQPRLMALERPIRIQPQYTLTTTQPPVYIQQPQYQPQPQYQTQLPPQQPVYQQQQPLQQPQQPSHSLQSESEICGKPHERFQFAALVVGGESVSRGAWPWLVAVYLNKATGLSFNCGGNLVSSKVVVTAAHCFRTPERQYTANEVVLVLGRYNILNWKEDGSKVAEVEQLVVHSDYMSKDTSYDADVAVVIMRDRVQYNEYIRPICLWEGPSNSNEIEGKMGTVVGWGRDGSGNIVTPEPKKINIPVVSEAVCLRSSDAYRHITSNRTFCAGGQDGTGPCHGDSGGGMTMIRNKRWTLRGIVSVGLTDPVVNTCNLGEYVVFTDAAKFANWIKSYMR